MHKHNILFIITILCLISGVHAQNKYVLSGFIKDAGSKELLIGTTVAIPKLKTGTTTNAYGFFSLTLAADTIEVIVSYVGYKPKAFQIILNENKELNIELEEAGKLNEVTVTADKVTQRISEETRMSVIEIPVYQVKDIPALLGEKDVLKVIQLMPGVQKPSEGNSGIYVRGGGPDQNLIILDEATVYNAFHLFGFFSLFNGDALKSIELTKGGFPARYGGRLSSVIDMSMKEGNKQKFGGEAGIGVLSSRLMLEGPIIKNKASFLVSARRTYFDVLARPFMKSTQKVGYYFYDLNAKANYEINNHNRIYVSGYFGRDRFSFVNNYGSNKDEGGIEWGNATGTLRWNHLYNNKTFSNTSFIFSDYKFSISMLTQYNNDKFSMIYSSGIRDFALKHDVDFRPNPNHTIKLGIHAINHQFTPSAIVLKDSYNNQDTTEKQRVNSYENAIYVEDDIKIGSRLRLNPGLRLSHFTAGKKNYFNLEPRINTSYKIKSDLAVKASYALMNQYIHLLSNTGIGLPTDLWVPSSDGLKPQQSWQVAGGLAKDFIDKNFSVSVEGYYKEMSNIISYKEGASFLEIDDPTVNNSKAFGWEKNITAGKGWSYGAEFLIQRKTGKLTGWIGYTLSWTQWQFDELNFGQKFWARYDRRHDFSIVAIYHIREQNDQQDGIKISATWVYGTGNAITLPVSTYDAPVHSPFPNNMGYNTVSQYTSKNAFRMAPYHRADIGIQIVKNRKWWVRTWEFSVYNIYSRQNPYFYYATTNNNGESVLNQVSLFPIIPSLSWNIKF